MLAARNQAGMPPLQAQGRPEGLGGMQGAVPQLNSMQRLGSAPNLGMFYWLEYARASVYPVLMM